MESDPIHIVACQRGGVFNEPLGQRQDTGPGISKLDNHLDKKILKGTNRTFDSPFLLRQGEPGTSQYIFPRNLFVRSFVRSLVNVCSVKTVGPRSSIFGMHVGLDEGLLIFYISGSKVKVK